MNFSHSCTLFILNTCALNIILQLKISVFKVVFIVNTKTQNNEVHRKIIFNYFSMIVYELIYRICCSITLGIYIFNASPFFLKDSVQRVVIDVNKIKIDEK